MKMWIFLLIPGWVFAQNANMSGEVTKLLQSLPASSRAKATYDFDHAERVNWHFVPRARNGVPLGDLNEIQRGAVFSILRHSLADQGYKKATSIVDLENTLRVVEGRGNNDRYRDPLNYYVTIFGTPEAKGTWGWRFEGHHVSLNFTLVNNSFESSTPSFFGSNPAIVREGKDRGKQILIEESRKGFELVNSLSPDQLNQALIAEEALPDIVSFNSRKAELLSPSGISFKAMTDAQQQMLLDLLKVYVNNYELGFSKKLMAKIQKAGIENLSFAWAGDREEGKGYYYRIQGPMLLIELDNTQNNANHIHSAVRDLTNDFGDDILREHYQKEHVSPK